jgi:8-amino-7-oxononanoate synthase
VLGEGREGARCGVGSVKTNIGHTETVAGIAGVIKVALALHHGELPPSLHFRQPNPYIDFENLPVRVQEKLEPLEGGAIAGVSAFGFGGTNAHLVLESAPVQKARKSKKKLHLLTLSAKSDVALRDGARNLEGFLGRSQCALADVCYTANVGRSAFPYRLAILADSVESLRQQLQDFVNGGNGLTGYVSGRSKPAEIDGELSREDLLQQVAEQFVQGAKIDWGTVYQGAKERLISLPTYPFQRQRFWAEGARLAEPQPLQVHPLLGQRLAGVDEVRFQVQIRPEAVWKDHCILGQPVFPAAVYLEMLRAAGEQMMENPQVQEFRIERSLNLSTTQTLQIVLKPQANGYTAQVFRLMPDDAWTLQASAQINEGEQGGENPIDRQKLMELPTTKEWSVDEFYHQLQAKGLNYGESFQGIQKLWQGVGEAVALVQIKDLQVSPYKLHPVLLDASFHALGALLSEPYLPVGCDRFQLFQTVGERVWSHVQIMAQDGQQVQANIWLVDDGGAIVAEVMGLSLQAMNHEPKKKRFDEWLYEVSWQRQPLEVQPIVEQRDWLIFADGKGLGEALAKALEGKGDRCTLVYTREEIGFLKETRFLVAPDRSEELRSFISQNSARNIVYLWSLEEDQELNLSTLQKSQINGCAGVLHLVQALAGASARLWLVTRGGRTVGAHSVQQAPLWGLAQVIRMEYPDLDCVSIDLDHSDDDLWILQQELNRVPSENQIVYHRENTSKNSDRYVPRLLPSVQNLPQEPFCLEGSGTLDDLKLVSRSRCTPAPHEVEIQVYAAGVNFRDVLNALGMLREYLPEGVTVPFGGECAGRIVAVGRAVEELRVGDEVMAAQAIGSLGSFVTVDARFVVRKPEGMSFAEAATIPVAFLTASYGLKWAGLKKGDRILIHSAAGGVGQAAVQIAQSLGAEIYATASPAKWQLLKDQGIERVMNSRTLDFAEEIRSLTNGAGVDVVFNSLNGEFIERSLGAIAPNGRFVEIGKIGIWTAEQVRSVRSDVKYFPFDLLDVSNQDPDLITDLLQELLPAFQQELKPLPHTTFPVVEVADAFRYMAQAKHQGKVVVEFPQPLVIREDASYLITGGVGALGIEAARWLIEKGARHLILTWHQNFSESAKAAIAQFKKSAVIQTVQVDVADAGAIESLFNLADMPPIRGILHAAGSLNDGALAKLDWQRFQQVMVPKVNGAWNLHVATQDLPLDFFVCFSSAAAVLGSPGQGNYAAANSFLDALMQERRRSGLPGLSVNWGAWSVGMAERMGQEKLAGRGVGAIAPAQGFQILEELLDESPSPRSRVSQRNPTSSPHQVNQIAVLPIDWAVFGTQTTGRKLPFLNEVLKKPQTVAETPVSIPGDLTQHIQTQVAKILGFSTAAKVDLHQNFDDMGMDSLMAVELSNYVRTLLGSSVPLDLAFDYPTVAALVEYLTQQGYGAGQIPHNGISHNGTNGHNGKKDFGQDSIPEIPAEFYQFQRSPEYLNMQAYLKETGKAGNPFFTVHDGIAKDTIETHGRELINYASYNYLDLSGHPSVNAATKAAIDRYGTSVSASRVVSGERPLHQELEWAIAAWVGAEDAIVYVGGHTTNTSTIGHLFGKDDLILYDALSHNSIRQGCALSNATAIEFPHNDWRSLDLLLSQQRRHYQKVLIAIEGIYSTDGDIAPLPEIVKIKTRHKAFLLVDEAHSIGVLGATGRGIGEYFGIAGNQVELWMGTLSKSFASCGGYIAGDRALVEYLKYTAPGFVFSVGMSPPNTASALAALRQLQAEPERVAQLKARSALFLELAKQKGFNTGMSQNSPVIPVIVGEAEKAIALSQHLAERGINAQPMIHPSVPLNGARLRFFISCSHTEAQIRSTVETLADAIAEVEAAV